MRIVFSDLNQVRKRDFLVAPTAGHKKYTDLINVTSLIKHIKM